MWWPGTPVVGYGCRKRKKLICGTEGEIVFAHDCLPSPAPVTAWTKWFQCLDYREMYLENSLSKLARNLYFTDVCFHQCAWLDDWMTYIQCLGLGDIKYMFPVSGLPWHVSFQCLVQRGINVSNAWISTGKIFPAPGLAWHISFKCLIIKG